MGIDISGGMIVGLPVDSIEYDDEEFKCPWGFAEEYGMEVFSLWYDAGSEGQVIGFTVPDIEVLSKGFEDWVLDVKHKALKFETITDQKAELIGIQNVW